MPLGPGRIAIGRKPKYVPNNREEIIRIIEGEKAMGWTERTQEEKDMWEDFKGPKPWPLSKAIPATLKFIGKLYMWSCTVGISAFIIFVLLHLMVEGG